MGIDYNAILYYGIELPPLKKAKSKATAGNWESFLDEKKISLPKGITIAWGGNAYTGECHEALCAWFAQDGTELKELSTTTLAQKYDELLLEAASILKIAKKYKKPKLHLSLQVW